MESEIEVLNGMAKVGDQVAYAVSDSRYGGAMRMGELIEITSDRRLKIRVTNSSSRWMSELPYFKTIQYPQRVVKVSA